MQSYHPTRRISLDGTIDWWPEIDVPETESDEHKSDWKNQ